MASAASIAVGCGAQRCMAAADSSSRKAIVFGIEKFATHDGPGIRTVVFLKGCPLRCIWCHSPESWKFGMERYLDGEAIGREVTDDELLAEVLQDRDFYEASGGGVTLSGGEPLARPEFCLSFLEKAKAKGLHVTVETSGFAPLETIGRLLPFVDLWLYDIKELDGEKFMKYTGRPLVRVLDNLRWLNDELVRLPLKRIVLRCPMIPGLNDDLQELERIAKLSLELKSVVRIDIEPYVPYGIDKARRLGLKVYDAPSPPDEYGPSKVEALQRLTSVRVALG